jgi:hypothetical protein
MAIEIVADAAVGLRFTAAIDACDEQSFLVWEHVDFRPVNVVGGRLIGMTAGVNVHAGQFANAGFLGIAPGVQ